MEKTALYPEHQKLNAKMVPFAGYEMPIQYQSILEEHHAVRKNVGVFDISHMGQFLIEGKNAFKDLQYLLSNDLNKITIGQAQYTLLCNQNGGIIDDLIVYQLASDKYLLIVNASNIDNDFAHLKNNLSAVTKLSNASDDYSMVALQGPMALEVFSMTIGRVKQINSLDTLDIHQAKGFKIFETDFQNHNLLVATTGYTGEHGVEICLPNQVAKELWNELLLNGALPCGLAARDTLRLEKCYPLHGNDISKDTNAVDAGLSWVIDFNKDFIGKESLLSARDNQQQKLVAIKCLERGIPRKDCNVYLNDQIIGKVTSGTMSVTLQVGIALAYLDIDNSAIGMDVEIDIRGRRTKAQIVKKPFV